MGWRKKQEVFTKKRVWILFTTQIKTWQTLKKLLITVITKDMMIWYFSTVTLDDWTMCYHPWATLRNSCQQERKNISFWSERTPWWFISTLTWITQSMSNQNEFKKKVAGWSLLGKSRILSWKDSSGIWARKSSTNHLSGASFFPQAMKLCKTKFESVPRTPCFSSHKWSKTKSLNSLGEPTKNQIIVQILSLWIWFIDFETRNLFERNFKINLKIYFNYYHGFVLTLKTFPFLFSEINDFRRA